MQRRTFNLGVVAGALALCRGGAADAEEYDDGGAVYGAVRSLPHVTIERGGGTLDVTFANTFSDEARARVFGWVKKSADALIAYYGHYPVRHANILVIANPGTRIGHGVSYGFGGPVIRVDFGVNISPDTLSDDWVMIHEMVHLSFPTISHRHLWLMEGSATYCEPVARGCARQRTAQSVWDEFFHSMDRGLPQSGDEGLDITHTWGRTYWGGAIFCLEADVRMRQATHNERGLADAMRAINRAAGSNNTEWSIEQVIATGDGATGSHVLADLYRSMGQGRETVDLGARFRALGVIEDGDSVRLDDSAPLAAIRRAITEPAPATPAS